MFLRAGFLFLCLVASSCAGSGVAPGSPERGFVVWGFVGQGTTTAAAGQAVTLVDAGGQPVQAVTSDGSGKYVFAYHRPGNYTVRVGQIAMPVVIAAEDQRLDIDLSAPGGTMNYAAGAAKAAAQASGPATCSAAPAPASAAGAPAEQRDPALAGNWSRVDSLSSGDSSMSTKLSLLICADGSYTRTVGDTVGGGAGWSAESRGSDSVRGRWRTEGNIVYVDSGSGWSPYARYYVEGNQLMLTFDSGKREIWKR